jgi:hypothetical protein
VAQADSYLPVRGFAGTTRRDAWWIQPAAVFIGFSLFIVYATWAAFQNAHYEFGPYLSPFYSPLIYGDSSHAWFSGRPGWWPAALPYSAAFLILWAPVGFRTTCYYYRGAYYKAFWADPPACAVGEPRSSYLGERTFPLVMQNVHRYFLLPAVALIAFLAHDAWKALWFDVAPGGPVEFGIGIGTLVLTINVVLLAGYTFGCHSLRHLAGGAFDVLSNRPVRRRAYGCVSALNRRHMLWAWVSLFWVGFSDVYVRLCAMGLWSDWRLI